MLHIASPSSPDNPNVDRNRLARIRRLARKRGLRVLKDWTGGYNLVDTHVEPPRALVGFEHSALSAIETAITTPLPPPRPSRKRKVARLDGDHSSQSSQAVHPAADGFVSLIDILKESAS